MVEGGGREGLKDQGRLETYQPIATYGPYLDSDFNEVPLPS